MTDVAADDLGPWLSKEKIDLVRRLVPMLYLNLVPVKLDTTGQIEAVGLLMSGTAEGGMVREIISGRVLLNESIRAAIIRHIEKDLGELALPQLPAHLTPFTVVEYNAIPGTEYYDRRQHAIAIAYIVPIAGECVMSEDSLDFSWFSARECWLPETLAQLSEGHACVLRKALAHMGHLPSLKH